MILKKIIHKLLPPPSSISSLGPNRIGWVDWSKAIGILFVVMGHSDYSNPDIVPMIYMIHMPLFFVVSGYLFNTDKSVKQITQKNIRGLIIPYILYNMLFAAYWILLGTLKTIVGQDFSWGDCLVTPAYHFLFGIAKGNFDGPTWFLLALIWCKYISYLLHNARVWCKTAAIVIWFGLFYVRQATGWHFIYALDCACAGMIWFELGQIIRLNKDRIKIPNFVFAALIPVGIAICYYVMNNNGNCNYILADVGGLFGLFGTALGLLAFFSFCKLVGRYNNRLIVLVSKASIVIMCLHMLINTQIYNVLHCQHQSFYTFAVDLMITILLALLYPLIKRYVPAMVGSNYISHKKV